MTGEKKLGKMQKGREDDSDRHDGSDGHHLSSSRSMKKMKKVADNNSELPMDVLDIISKKLDFDDLFEFAGVCKSWRDFHKIYWRSFVESQTPLLVQTSAYAKKTFSFVSLPEKKTYSSKTDYIWGLRYTGSSSGYLIIAGLNNTLFLMNPFTRRKKVINTSTVQGKLLFVACNALLAFVKGSEEFVIVVKCKYYDSLHVYHSRNSSWVTYCFKGNPWKVVDFVVLNNTIYVITDKGNIGVLSLNSVNVKFLELKNTLSVTWPQLNLVNCDDQLLVVCFKPGIILNAYKIEFSTMSYVKMDTLGDIALFYAGSINGRTNCYAMSNPHRWGFESNYVYFINCISAECKMYSGDDNRLKKLFYATPSQEPRKSKVSWLGWCFKHIRNEVDYSLVE